jgi:hypothetical protein
LYWHGAVLELLFLRALFLTWQSKRSPRVMRKPAAHIVDTAAASTFLALHKYLRQLVSLYKRGPIAIHAGMGTLRCGQGDVLMR